MMQCSIIHCAPELSAWQLLKSIIVNFLGKKQSAECEREVEECLKKYLKNRGSHVIQNALSAIPL